MKTFNTVLFDLDGTLFHSDLSFDNLRKRLGLESSEPLLEHIEKLDIEFQLQCHHAICEVEQKFAKSGSLDPIVPKLLENLRLKDIDLAIWTRNSQKATEISLGEHIEAFDIICTRENAKAKPDPEGLYDILRQCNCDLEQAIFIGDSKFDVQAAQTVGIKTFILNAQLSKQLPIYDHICYMTGLEDFLELSSKKFR